MKLSITALLLGVLATETDAGKRMRVEIHKDGFGGLLWSNVYNTITGHGKNSIGAWYGYSQAKANTPPDSAGSGMEDVTSNVIGIAGVDFGDHTSIAVIIDATDTTGGKVEADLLCDRGTCGVGNEHYPSLDFIAVKDDPDNPNVFGYDQYSNGGTNNGPIHIEYDFRGVKTDGFATVPIKDGSRLCMRFQDETGLGNIGVVQNDGTYQYDGFTGKRALDGSSLGVPFQKIICITAPSPIIFGDPHLRTWAGETYDFHGVCDLVLLHNPLFKNNLGMDVHIRTKKMRAWSYVSSAVLRIGQDTLEVMGGNDKNSYWINGAKGAEKVEPSVLQNTIAGYPIMFTESGTKSREFVVDLGSGVSINIKIWNAFVSVSVTGGSKEAFGSSIGLMGNYQGVKMARDNSTVIDEANMFGQEWQVLPSEAKLFHNVEGPQAPEKCEIPTKNAMRRRLAESIVSREDAGIACARVNEQDFDLCVFDVMATNDKEAVGAY